MVLFTSVHVLPPLHTKYACPHKIWMFYMSRKQKKQIHASRQRFACGEIEIVFAKGRWLLWKSEKFWYNGKRSPPNIFSMKDGISIRNYLRNPIKMVRMLYKYDFWCELVVFVKKDKFYIKKELYWFRLGIQGSLFFKLYESFGRPNNSRILFNIMLKFF